MIPLDSKITLNEGIVYLRSDQKSTEKVGYCRISDRKEETLGKAHTCFGF